MNRIVIILLLTLMAAAPLAGQTSYYYNFETPAEMSGWTTVRRYAGTTAFSWTLDQGAYSGTNCLRHEFPAFSSSGNDDWYISPVFSIVAGGKIDSLRAYFSGPGIPGNNDTVAIYLLTGSNNPASVTTGKTLLFDFRAGDYINDSTWRLITNITIPVKSQPCYIAFRYITTNTWMDARFDHLKIKINSPVGLTENKAADHGINLFPNPAAGTLAFSCEDPSLQNETVTLTVYNLIGEQVLSTAVEFGEPLSHTLKTGVYSYQLTGTKPGTLKCGRVFVKSD